MSHTLKFRGPIRLPEPTHRATRQNAVGARLITMTEHLATVRPQAVPMVEHLVEAILLDFGIDADPVAALRSVDPERDGRTRKARHERERNADLAAVGPQPSRLRNLFLAMQRVERGR